MVKAAMMMMAVMMAAVMMTAVMMMAATPVTPATAVTTVAAAMTAMPVMIVVALIVSVFRPHWQENRNVTMAVWSKAAAVMVPRRRVTSDGVRHCRVTPRGPWSTRSS